MEQKYIKDFSTSKDYISVILGNLNDQHIEDQDIKFQIIDNNGDNDDNIKLNLDGAIKSQLTLKFIKSSDNSEWSKFSKLFEEYYKNETENYQKIKELADIYSEKLSQEYKELKTDKNCHVSSAGLFAPRIRSTFNRKDRSFKLPEYIANKIFLDTGLVKEKLHAAMHYSRLISGQTKKYIRQHTENFLNNNKHKLLRILNHNKKNWCKLKEKSFSSVVTEPKAMDVSVSKFEELKDFFDFLKSNDSVTINSVDVEPCMKFNRGAIYEDKRIDLCKQVVGPDWIGNLMESLNNNDHVEHFLLGNNIIGTKGGQEIGKYLQNNHVMKTWYLAGNNLNSEGIKPIVDGLLEDTICENLWLKRNPLKPEGIKEIGRLMKINNHIKVLDLHNTAVFDEGLIYLMEGLKHNRTLEYLYLDANGITEYGIEPILDYFKYLKDNNLVGIKSLWLDMNKLFDNGVIKIVKELKDYKYLERLCLGSNGITEESIDSIVDSFVNHESLIMLDLGMYKSTFDMGMITNNIGDVGINKLKPLIENNKKIRHISVLMNGITEKGLLDVIESIEKNDTLFYFEYKQYNVNFDGHTYDKIKSKLEENRKNNYPVPNSKILRHGEKIHWIDSIYRNNDK